MSVKAKVVILRTLIVIAVLDVLYTYLHNQQLEFFYVGSILMTCGIGLDALKKIKENEAA
jgi:hypothetical protein